MMRLTLCACLFFLAAPLMAQEPEAAGEVEDGDAAARVLYLRGDRLYSEGRYQEATEAFSEAYELSGRPGLLFNMANALERLGRLEEALAALRRFAPDAAEHDRATVNARIASLETRLREEDAQQRQAEARPTADARATPEEAPGPAPAEGSAPANGGGGRATGITFLTLGGAALVGGLISGILAKSSTSELEDMCIDGSCPLSAQGTVDAEGRRALTADILFIAGGVLVVGGIIALIAGRPSDDDDGRARLEVMPRRDGLAASLSASF